MDKGFWLERWEAGRTAFHEGRANGLLVEHWGRLSVAEGGRVLLPLCGKTRDVAWLLSQGVRVVGVELSRRAVDELFAELGVEPEVEAPTGAVAELLRYRASGVEVFVGDVFALPRALLGDVDAVYDRAALVALPVGMRERYARLLVELTERAPQLLISYEYDQSLMEGPPFSVSDAELGRYYGDHYQLTRLERREIDGGLKGICPVWESAWLLQAR